MAGHQIAANLVSLIFMMPLALSNATSTLVAQSIGANRLHAARRLGWHGLQLTMAMAVMIGALVFVTREAIVGLYTRDAVRGGSRAVAVLGWVALFHLGDALQTFAQFVLRACAHHRRAAGGVRAGACGAGSGRRLHAGLRRLGHYARTVRAVPPASGLPRPLGCACAGVVLTARPAVDAKPTHA